MDRPDGRRVLKFDGLSGRGLWYRPQGDEYEVSVTGLAVCVICDTISSATYFLVSPLGEVPRSGKGCTRQSTDVTLYRYPARQSAVSG